MSQVDINLPTVLVYLSQIQKPTGSPLLKESVDKIKNKTACAGKPV
jgi:hypothetical protein